MSSEMIDRREALRRAALVLGGALSPTTVAGVLAGMESPRARWAADATPRVLTARQLELVATVAEHIIPATDTPGARAAGVQLFIDTMLAEYYTADQRRQFVDGLGVFDDRAHSAAGKPFLQLSAQQQRVVLDALDHDAFVSRRSAAAEPGKETERGVSAAPPADVKRPDTSRLAAAPVPFFRTFKELTVVGYYTSQIGATQELRYDRVPGRFEGCVPFKTIGRAWSV